MKGLFIHQNVEYLLETKRETWCQGDVVDGVVKVRNHGSEKITISSMKVIIASGEFKKVKAKTDGCYQVILEEEVVAPFELAGKETKEFPVTIKLKEDAPITDKSSSLYLLYGPSDLGLMKLGQLQLTINVHRHIGEILKVFEGFVRFKLNSLKAKGATVEAKLFPPNNRQFAILDYLNLKLNLEEDILKLKYVFKFRSLGSEYAELKVQVKKKEVKQELTKKDYSLYGDYPNHDGIKKKIEEVLDSEFKNKF